MPYCVKCGSPIKSDDKFCIVCGAATAKFTSEEFDVKGKDLIDRVGQLLHEGNVTRVIVKDESGKTLLEIPRDCWGYWGGCGSVACCIGRDCGFGY